VISVGIELSGRNAGMVSVGVTADRFNGDEVTTTTVTNLITADKAREVGEQLTSAAALLAAAAASEATA